MHAQLEEQENKEERWQWVWCAVTARDRRKNPVHAGSRICAASKRQLIKQCSGSHNFMRFAVIYTLVRQINCPDVKRSWNRKIYNFSDTFKGMAVGNWQENLSVSFPVIKFVRSKNWSKTKNLTCIGL
ncbi:unnamed protein product [Sphenostylis stenocarpa]|uniref:Uncharacterized protein n=1 Tax=Sphenostylis stenocarpa TaxID=92480 RepID=A0AA86VUK6_9FABA|nr:unnamed protein product [Sphenostylis stenocarpa]